MTIYDYCALVPTIVHVFLYMLVVDLGDDADTHPCHHPHPLQIFYSNNIGKSVIFFFLKKKNITTSMTIFDKLLNSDSSNPRFCIKIIAISTIIIILSYH